MDIHSKNQILNQKISKLQTEFFLISHSSFPNWSVITHKHQTDTIYLILDDGGKAIINDTTLYPQKNSMVLLPKGSVVSLYSENSACYNKYRCDFMMHFDGVSLFDVVDFPYMTELSDISRALELFRLLDSLHLNNDVYSALRIKASLLELVSMFLENYTPSNKTLKTNAEFVYIMKSFISEHISEKLPVSRLAGKMGFNEKYFIEVFKNHFGKTPAKYVKTARLEKAKNELLYTNDKIMYIPSKIGYATLQQLSRDFKSYTGFTLSEYRKKFK